MSRQSFLTQRALRDRLMSRGKNCLPTVSRQFLTRNYPRPNCLLKCLPNCLSPIREGFLSSFKINPAVRVIARQLRDKNCLAAICAPRHQSVSSGPLGSRSETWVPKRGGLKPAGKRQESATFLQRSFFDVAVQFLVCCSAAFGPNDFRTAEKPRCCSAVSAAQHSENCSATSEFSLVACCRGGV